jgi:hypothetical protein
MRALNPASQRREASDLGSSLPAGGVLPRTSVEAAGGDAAERTGNPVGGIKFASSETGASGHCPVPSIRVEGPGGSWLFVDFARAVAPIPSDADRIAAAPTPLSIGPALNTKAVMGQSQQVVRSTPREGISVISVISWQCYDFFVTRRIRWSRRNILYLRVLRALRVKFFLKTFRPPAPSDAVSQKMAPDTSRVSTSYSRSSQPFKFGTTRF